jgi:hypothetical protein
VYDNAAMKLRLRIAVICFCAFWALTQPLPAWCLDRFAVMGDTGIGRVEEVYKTFLDHLTKEGIGTFFIVGDVIDRPGKEEEWLRFNELTGLSRGVHIAPGNHDINNYKALKVYRKYVKKPPYYAFSEGDTLFILLCTDLPDEIGKVTGKQLKWLKDELQKPFKFKMVFLHKPLFPTPLGKGYVLDKYPAERDVLEQVLKENKVDIVFAGHEHLYKRIERGGIVYVTTGGGGATLLTPYEESGGFHHYIVAKRNDGGYLFRVYDPSGSTRDEFSIYK